MNMERIKKMHAITTLTDYLNCIKEISYNDPIDNKNIYRCFRGQANKNWELIPSLFRDNNLDEYKLLKESRRILWKELNIFNSLEQLTLLQHYGLPTRLLDVTMNPLVALYFACLPPKEEKVDVDGAVYIIDLKEENNDMKEANNDWLLKLCNALFTNNDLKIFLNESLKSDSNKKHTICIRDHFILPPLSDERIERQSGAFIFSEVFREVYNMNIYLRNTFDVRKHYKYKIVVPRLNKTKILQELRECGIHEGFLFPDVEHKIKYITQTVLHK